MTKMAFSICVLFFSSFIILNKERVLYLGTLFNIFLRHFLKWISIIMISKLIDIFITHSKICKKISSSKCQINGALSMTLNNQYQPDNFNNMPNYNNIIPTKFEGPEDTFAELLSPIQSPSFPTDLIIIKNKIIELILSRQLQVKPVLNYLLKFKHLNGYDLMVAALIALGDSLPNDCHIRYQIEKLVMHAKFNRCHVNNVNHNSFPRNPIPTKPTLGYVPTKLDCESIIGMIKYFQTLLEQSDCFQCKEHLVAGPLQNLQSIDQMYKRHSTVLTNKNVLINEGESYYNTKLDVGKQLEQKFIKISQAIESLPAPKSEEEEHNYEIVKSFIHSSDLLEYVQNLKESDYIGKEKLFKVIAQQIVHSSANISIQHAFSYYLNYNIVNATTATTTTTTTEAPVYDYSTLIELVPQPLDAEEREKFKLVKEFLSIKLNYKYLVNINASYYTDTKLLYKTVFKTLSECDIEAKVKEAFSYYLNYQESLTELELFTKKEIKKHFELTKIFVDTLDIDSLSTEAKLSFKKFFKFISNIKREQLKEFHAWSEVKTKGEFMKALFTFLLEQRFVPLEVHQAILQLQTLVRMDGRGAAPP